MNELVLSVDLFLQSNNCVFISRIAIDDLAHAELRPLSCWLFLFSSSLCSLLLLHRRRLLLLPILSRSLRLRCLPARQYVVLVVRFHAPIMPWCWLIVLTLFFLFVFLFTRSFFEFFSLLSQINIYWLTRMDCWSGRCFPLNIHQHRIRCSPMIWTRRSEPIPRHPN